MEEDIEIPFSDEEYVKSLEENSLGTNSNIKSIVNSLKVYTSDLK